MAYRWLPHTADLKVEITADSLPGVLADAAAVVRELLVGSSQVRPRESRNLAVSGGPGGEAELLFAFLRALLELYHNDRFVPALLEVGEIASPGAGLELAGAVRGEPFDPARHEAQPEVKAVTRHDLSVRRHGEQWVAQVIFDV
jgi:SHS2 domain-containing protein